MASAAVTGLASLSPQQPSALQTRARFLTPAVEPWQRSRSQAPGRALSRASTYRFPIPDATEAGGYKGSDWSGGRERLLPQGSWTNERWKQWTRSSTVLSQAESGNARSFLYSLSEDAGLDQTQPGITRPCPLAVHSLVHLSCFPPACISPSFLLPWLRDAQNMLAHELLLSRDFVFSGT